MLTTKNTTAAAVPTLTRPLGAEPPASELEPLKQVQPSSPPPPPPSNRKYKPTTNSTNTKSNKSSSTIPFTDEVLPFYGWDNWCFSLRGSGSGAGCLIELEGLNYTEADPSTLLNLQRTLAEAYQTVALSGGQPNDGVMVQLCVDKRRRDTTDLIQTLQNDATRLPKGEGRLGQVGRWDAQHLKRIQKSNGVVEWRYYIAVVLTEKAYKIEQATADQELELEEMLQLRARLDAEAGAALEAATIARLDGSLWQKMKHNAAQNWEEMRGNATKNNQDSDYTLGGSIYSHGVKVPLAEILIRKAEMLCAGLAPFGLRPHILTNSQGARAFASLLGLPASQTLFPLSQLELDAQQTASITGSSGFSIPLDPDNLPEPIDVQQFGLSTFEFDSRYVKVAALPAQGVEKPTYFSALYVDKWPREMRFGQLISLLAQVDLDFVATSTISPVPPRRAQRKLERKRDGLDNLRRFDQTPQTQRELRNEQEEIDEVLEQFASGDGSAMQVTIRLVVKSHTPTRLKSGVRALQGKLAGAGFSAKEANFNQAYGLFSALPFGRDFIATSAGYGPNTVRVMTAEAAATLFPALVHDEGGQDGVLFGVSDLGGLIRFDTSNVPVKHMAVFGMPGAGKTVSKEGWMIRMLLANPKLKVRIVDLQDVTYEPVETLGGEAVRVGSDGHFRINMLDRSAYGKPTMLGDMNDAVTKFLILMRGAGLNTNEDSFTQTCLLQLYTQFEQGESLLEQVIQGLYHRYSESLGFKFNRHLLLTSFLQALYERLTAQFKIPNTGYVVSPVYRSDTGQLIVYNPITGEYLDDYDTPLFEQRESHNVSIGVRLRLWHTSVNELGHNLYAGGGYSELEIPYVSYKQIKEMVEKQGFEDFQKEAMISYFLLCHLHEAEPRRPVDWQPPTRLRRRTDGGTSTGTGTGNGDVIVTSWWQHPPKDAASRASSGIIGTNASPKGGALLYNDNTWWQKVEHTFNMELKSLGYRATPETGHTKDGDGRFVSFWANVGSWAYSLIQRDCLMPLKRGVPILSDLVTLLYHQPVGIALANSLEPYVHKNIQGQLYSGHTNYNTSNRLSTFCMKNLSEKQMGLRVMQIIHLLSQQIYNQPPDETTILFWDEYGSLVTLMPELSDFVQMLFKRTRTFGAIIVLGEQSYELALSPAGSKAMDCVGIIELMKQSDKAARLAAADLGLTRKEMDFLKNAKPGESLFIFKENGRTRKMIAKCNLPPELINILSTKPEDKAARDEARRKRAGRKEASPTVQLVIKYGGKDYME